MFPLTLSIVFAATITILLTRAVRQSKLYEAISKAPAPDSNSAPEIAVIIPARNEAHSIARCLASITEQDYPQSKLKIVVVDDNSTDDTAAIVRQVAASDSRVHLIQGNALPSGWAGKPHACWQGAQAEDSLREGESAWGRLPVRSAASLSPPPSSQSTGVREKDVCPASSGPISWLCFIDADTSSNPALFSSALNAATQNNLAMLSLEPFQELVTLWERLLIPAGMLMLAFTQDISRVNNPASSDAVANGQFILIRRDIYDSVGGHSAVRSAICEDTALARQVKSAGRPIGLYGAEQLIRTRMYTGLSSLWQGISKNATEMLHGLLPTTLCALGGYALAIATFLIPILCIHHPIALTIALLTSLSLLLPHISVARHFRIPWYTGLLFPIAYLVGSTLLLNSVKMRLRGQVSWKGRIYNSPSPGTPGEGWGEGLS